MRFEAYVIQDLNKFHLSMTFCICSLPTICVVPLLPRTQTGNNRQNLTGLRSYISYIIPISIAFLRSICPLTNLSNTLQPCCSKESQQENDEERRIKQTCEVESNKV